MFSYILKCVNIAQYNQHPQSSITISTYLVLVFGHHLMGQVKQRDESILGHTFPHKRQGVAAPLYIK